MITEQQKTQIYNLLWQYEFFPKNNRRKEWTAKDDDNNTMYIVYLDNSDWLICAADDSKDFQADGDYSSEGFAKLLTTLKGLV